MDKTYFIITIGCYMNISDSERFAAFLEDSGFRLVQKKELASLVIINTCGVKQMAENRVYGLVQEIKKHNPKTKIVVTGCLSKRKDVKRRLISQVDWFLPAGEMFLLPNLLQGSDFKETYSLDKYRLSKGEKYLKIKPKYQNEYSAFVPIGNGCNNFCSYCVVPYARGREVYRPAKDIIREVKDLINKGFKEITLIAQNVNSYHDDDYKFPKLLTELIKIPGKFWLRFSSSHPKDMSDDLIRVIASSDKICNHLHLALQSGDDKILELMNRKYSANHFKSLIKKIREARPGIAVTTDIIVGFPTETKAQFLNTVKLFKELVFDMAYISQYSPRPETVSAETMKDDVSILEKKRRFSVLNEELKKSAIKANSIYLGKEIEVLVDGINRRGKYSGKSSSFKTVTINNNDQEIKIGSFVKVLINKSLAFGLEGGLVLKDKPKVLVILGPTASGKTKLGVDLARKFNGEIISADSRQVYRGMDIGTGKDLVEYGLGKNKIKHHLIDIVSPKDDFDLAKYQRLAFIAINDVLKRKKLPIIVGGSGLYLQAIIDNYCFDDLGTNRAYRDELEKLSVDEIFDRLQKIKPEFAAKINNSDRHNKRRLARYLEIVEKGGPTDKTRESVYDFLVLGLDFPDEIMRSRISYRLLSRLEEGMIAEVKSLKDKGLSNEKLEAFGLEYRYLNRHLNGELSYKEMIKQLEIASYRFAKRQKTWFRRFAKQGREIIYLDNLKDAEKIVSDFI